MLGETRIQPQTFTRLVEGQILETLGPGGDEDPLEHYLRVVAGKTGSLIATSGPLRRAGSPARPPTSRRRSPTYGEKVGVAFQLSDDILDIGSETEESGKTPGTDLREGVPTLPVLIAKRSTDPADPAPARPPRRRPRRSGPARRGAGPAARPPGDGRGPQLRGQPGHRGQDGCSRCCPRGRPGPPSRPSPTPFATRTA